MNNTSKQKHILVIGGAGFIGSATVKVLQDAGYQTTVFDNLSQGDKRTVFQGEFIEGDLCRPEDIASLFKGRHFDAVLHFAALTDVGESHENPLRYYKHNVSYTLNLLEEMIKNDIRHFIFSSTAALFGIPIQAMVDESHPCNPISPYGESKLIVEKVLKDMSASHYFSYCSLRYFNAAGGDPSGRIKNYKKKENNLIPLIIKSLKSGDSSISIFGTDYPTKDGTCIRDYIHVTDLAHAHLQAMEKLLQGASSTCYNLGNGAGFSVKEVIAAVERVTGQKLTVDEKERRPGDPPILVANAAKARRELNWQPKFPDLDTIIRHAWQAL